MRMPFAWALIAAMLLLCGKLVNAQELRCEPAPIGTGTLQHSESIDEVGQWSVYYCRTPCAWSAQFLIRRKDHDLILPEPSAAAGMNARQYFQEVYKLNRNVAVNDPSVIMLTEAAIRWAERNEPEQPACKVAPTNTSATTRPAYVLDPAGRIGHLSANRAPIGAKCRCLPGQRAIGSGNTPTYCAWEGAQLEPFTEVAVCRP